MNSSGFWGLDVSRRAKNEPLHISGTSRWIAAELCYSSNVVCNYSQKFAFSVSAEISWIDESLKQIKERDEGQDALMLLRSPVKENENSPIKECRKKELGVSPGRSGSDPLAKKLTFNKELRGSQSFDINDFKPITQPSKQRKVTAPRLPPLKSSLAVSPVKQDSTTSPSVFSIENQIQKASRMEPIDLCIANKSDVKTELYKGPASPESEEEGNTSFQFIRDTIRKSLALKGLENGDVNKRDDNGIESDRNPKEETDRKHSYENQEQHSKEIDGNEDQRSAPIISTGQEPIQSKTPSSNDKPGFVSLPSRGRLTLRSSSKVDKLNRAVQAESLSHISKNLQTSLLDAHTTDATELLEPICDLQPPAVSTPLKVPIKVVEPNLAPPPPPTKTPPRMNHSPENVESKKRASGFLSPKSSSQKIPCIYRDPEKQISPEQPKLPVKRGFLTEKASNDLNRVIIHENPKPVENIKKSSLSPKREPLQKDKPRSKVSRAHESLTAMSLAKPGQRVVKPRRKSEVKKHQAVRKALFKEKVKPAMTISLDHQIKHPLTKMRSKSMKLDQKLDPITRNQIVEGLDKGPGRVSHHKGFEEHKRLSPREVSTRKGNRSTHQFDTSYLTPHKQMELPDILSDNEEKGSGVMAAWADSPELRKSLLLQQSANPDVIFGPIAPLNIDEIFKSIRLARFKGRRSDPRG